MNKIRNPKAETRRKFESRNSKSESLHSTFSTQSSDAPYSAAGWFWADAPNDHVLFLKEDASGKNAAAPLDERTEQFGEAIIRFAKKIPRNPVNDRLISQLVGAGTSVGANFCEAEDSVSGKEFKLKIGTCRKESKETMLFLRLIATAEPTLASEARILWREAKELNLIFGSIWRKK